MQRGFTRKMSLIALLVLLFSFCLYGPAASQPTTPFKDIKSNFWGFKDIIKMQVRGVVSGYRDGSFGAGKTVTQMEAVLMAVSNMGGKDQLSGININQPLPVSVPSWVEKGSKREVLFAIQKGLIIPSEKNFDANAGATRAWLAQLIVRMIDKNEEASQLSGQPVPVQDAGSVPSWLAGYVNVAFKYKLIAGYPDNTFKPARNVTRAEIVAMLSRSEQYLALGESVILAKVTGLSGQNLSLLVNNVPRNVSISPLTWVFDSKGQLINWAGLKNNDAVKVVLNGSYIKYAEILPAEAVLTKIRGTVLQVLAKEKVIVIKDEKQGIITKTLTQSTAVTGQTGEINSLDQVVTGNEVEIGLDSTDNVISVLVLNNGVSSSGNKGVIYSLNQVQKLIIIKNPAGKFNTFQYSDQVIVKIPGQRFPAIKDLQVGDEVKYTATSAMLTEIELVQAQKQLTMSGVVVLISQEKRILTIQKDTGSLEAFAISDSVEILINGANNPLLSNVLVNDTVDLSIEEGKVKSVTVKDRNAESTLKGTVIAIDTNNRILTVKTVKDELKVYEVSQRAEFMINDRTSTALSEVKKDMKVEIQLVDNKVVYLETKNTVEGAVVSLEQSRHVITIKVNDLNSQSYILSNSVDVDIEGDSSADLNDINKNDYVELRIEDNVVTKINVQRSFTYQVINVYKSSNEIKVEEPDDDTRYLTISARVAVVVPGVTNPDIEDFAVGNVVKATFLGSKLSKLEVAPVNHSQVTSVNTYSNTVTVKSFEGTITTYTFGDRCEVLNGTQKSTQLSTLVVGDRVEVKEKADGGKTFSVMEKVVGKYQSYTTSDNKIYVSKDPITWRNYYVSSKVYVHSGTQSLSLSNLAKDNSVDVYVLNDIVYEIEKK